jgi:hypothetical protein
MLVRCGDLTHPARSGTPPRRGIYQLATVHCSLFTVHYQLSTTPYPLFPIPYRRIHLLMFACVDLGGAEDAVFLELFVPVC